MRKIALINQKGGVGKTTTAVNLGAALAEAQRRVLLVDLDPQANLSLHLDRLAGPDERSTYDVLTGNCTLAEAVRPTGVPGLSIVPSNIDLSGAELELAATFGREGLLKEAVEAWSRGGDEASTADYILLDCPPSLGLLSINGMVAADAVVLVLQTEFFALQGMSKLVEVIGLLRRRLNPRLEVAGILPCLYDSRLKLAREVLAEIREHFPGQVFERPITKNVKLAEAPSFGKTIFQYAPESTGALDYRALAAELIAQEGRGSAGAAVGAASAAPKASSGAPPPEPPAAGEAPAAGSAVLVPRPSPPPRRRAEPRAVRGVLAESEAELPD